MIENMDPTFSEGLRRVLVRQVETAPRRRRRSGWRWGIGGLVVAGLLGSGAAFASQLWVQPGADAHTALASPVTATETGTATIRLGARPKGANEVAMEFSPLDAGSYFLGVGGAALIVDPAQDPASDINSATPYYLQPFQLNAGQTSITITTSPSTLHWKATFTWVSARTTPWAVNAAGETYGEQNAKGSPDLIAVTATNGKTGYVYSKQLDDVDGTTAAGTFTNPQQALQWQKTHHGGDIPVFTSNGKTKIGVFHVGQ
ncbi:peptidase M56 family protein [Gryllotalpicola reticulitermitis]|uniref:Peptidase M56 family protein n=1 Tax=Gryllotalpicola reticulitermitis TaxID=1184153 RepID=A0ABV8Q0L8_9MICO